MKPTTLIKGGRVVDPANNIDMIADVLICDGRVMGVGEAGNIEPAKIIDAKGLLVAPGLIDMHVHLREPGFEDSETIDTGRRAAAVGGFTAVACMPNTEPVLDTQASIEYVLKRAEESPGPRVYPIAAITKGRKSRETVDFELMSQAGAVGFTDDGSSVESTDLMQKAMQRIKPLEKPAIVHCENLALVAGGVINEGQAAEKFGLPPISAESESSMVRRDVDLARATGCHLHICHISVAQSLEIIAKAKNDGVRVTAEVTPHHLMLCDEDIATPDPNFKMKPPLRSASDVAALRKGLAAGVIDVVACDHAPHSPARKGSDFARAAFGVVGLETSLGIISTMMIHKGLMDWTALIERMSTTPARILGIDGGTLSVGAKADITIIDPAREWIVEPAKFVSKSKNTCFGGKSLKGKAVLAMVAGEVVYDDLAAK